MGFLAPAIPWIASGIGSWLGGRKATSSAMQRSPEEQQALNSAQSTGQQLLQQGQRFSQLGLPAIQSGMNYWDTLLRGNRAMMSQATAGARGSITDTYRGAMNSLEHSNVRGAARDQATEELNRDRAGKIAGLTTGVQPEAAQQLSSLGSGLTGQGIQQLGGAGNLW